MNRLFDQLVKYINRKVGKKVKHVGNSDEMSIKNTTLAWKIVVTRHERRQITVAVQAAAVSY